MGPNDSTLLDYHGAQVALGDHSISWDGGKGSVSWIRLPDFNVHRD